MSHYTYEIIGGLLIFLSSLVSEAFPKRLRIALWIVFALLAAGYTAVGIHLDKAAATAAEGERTKSTNETKDLNVKVRALETNTSNLISTIANVLPMIASLNSDLAHLRKSTEAAKEHHDPRLIDNLEHQTQIAQQQVDTLSHELLALTMAPQVAEQLRELEGESRGKQQDLHNREWEEQIHWRERHPDDNGEGMTQMLKEWDVAYAKADEDSIEQLKRTIATADFIRRELLQRIPPQQQSAEDKRQEQTFSQAKNNPESVNRENAARYLEELARRVPPPPK